MSLWIWDVLLATKYGEQPERGLGGVAEGHDHAGVGLDAVVTAATLEDGLGDAAISCVAGAGVELLVQPALAPRTRELPVELVLLPELGGELILESLYCSTHKYWVHLFENAHEARVAECPRR